MRNASRGVRRGRLTTCASAFCRSLGSAFVAGLFCRRHQVPFGARDTIVSARSGGGVGDSARSGMRASELRTLRERSEPNHSFGGESPEGLPFGAGLGRREAQKKWVAGAGWRTLPGSRAGALAASGDGRGRRLRATLPGAVAGSGR